MADFNVTVNGHTIEIDTSSWNGSEEVLYDGQSVSKKRSFMYLTAHSFTVTEAEETIVHEVNVVTGLASHGYIVRRNGIIVAHEP
jgi:archaellum component FlaF (FlaF/FlaG flagellin family)